MIPIGPKVIIKKISLKIQIFGTVGHNNFLPIDHKTFRLAVGSEVGSNVHTQAVVPYYKIITF